MILTDQTLGEVVFALRTALGRVREDELSSPTMRTQWSCLQQWLNDADAFRRPDLSGDDFVRLKAFPLSGTELRTLRLAVDQASRRAELPAASYARQRQAREAPHQTIGRVTRTSIVLVAALIISLLFNVAWLALFHLGIIVVPHLSLVLSINSLATALAFLAWSLHHWQLLRHVRAVHWHRPQIAHFLHPHAH